MEKEPSQPSNARAASGGSELFVISFTSKENHFLGLIEALVPKGVYTSAYLNSPVSESRLFQSNHQTTPDQCWGIVCLIDSSDPSLNLAIILDVLVQFEKRISVGPGEALRTIVIDVCHGSAASSRWLMQFFFALGFEYFLSNPKDAELQEIFNGQFLEHDYRGEVKNMKKFDKKLFRTAIPPNWRSKTTNPAQAGPLSIPSPPASGHAEVSVLHETCMTEIIYVRSLLGGLECYLRPLGRIRNFFDASHIPNLFKATEIMSDMYNCHRRLLAQICQSLLSPVEEIDTTLFVDKFLSGLSDELVQLHFDYRGIYNAFAGEVDMINVHRYKGWFKALYEILPEAIWEHKLEPPSYFIMPVARLARYVLLFELMLRHYPEHDAEGRRLLQELIAKLRNPPPQ